MTDPFYGPDLAMIHARDHEGLAHGAARTLAPLVRRQAKLLDLGCGAGPLCVTLAKLGHQVIGIDHSEALVAIARQRLPHGDFRQGDILTATFSSADVVAAIGEVVNYATAQGGKAALTALFRRVREILPKDGLFLFDCAGPKRHDNREMVWSEAEDAFVAMSAMRKNDELVRHIVTFVSRDRTWHRSCEHHHLRTYDPAYVMQLLERTGFKARALPGYDETRLPKGLHVFLATAIRDA